MSPPGSGVKVFAGHTNLVLTLSSASIPAIAVVLGIFIGRDGEGALVVPPFLNEAIGILSWSLYSFLVAIVGGVVYSLFLALKVNTPTRFNRVLRSQPS